MGTSVGPWTIVTMSHFILWQMTAFVFVATWNVHFIYLYHTSFLHISVHMCIYKYVLSFYMLNNIEIL